MRAKTTKFLDPILIAVPFIIVLLSIFTLYSTSPQLQVFTFDAENVVLKQLVFLIIGIVIMLVLSRIDLSWTQSFIIQGALLGGATILLSGLFFLGGLVNETNRWYIIGPFLFQPSEFVKYILIFWVAFFLSRKTGKPLEKGILLTAGAGLILGLIFLQPDAGTTIMTAAILAIILAVWMSKYEIGRKFILFMIILLFFFACGWFVHPLFYSSVIIGFGALAYKDALFFKIGLASILGIIVFAVAVYGMWHSGVIKDYQKQRILTFIGSEEETFQIHQSKVAIGSGQWTGKGVGQGTQSRLKFLPEYRTDFIFAAYTEERGFVGGMLLIGLYLLLILRMVFIAIQTKDEYIKLIALGLAIKLWVEVFVNIGMNLGLLPTKGVALPFMSYGGSSLLSNFILIGLFQAIYLSHARNDKIQLSGGLETLV